MRRISASEAAKIAAAQAELALLQMQQRQEEAAERRARTRRQNVALIASGCAVLAVLMVLGAVYVTMIPSVERTPIASRGAAPGRLVSAHTGIVRFAEDGTSNKCRQVDFNNKSGRFSNESLVPCYEPAAPDWSLTLPQSQAGERFDSLRGSFMQR